MRRCMVLVLAALLATAAFAQEAEPETTAAAPEELSLPAGTGVKMKLETPISSATSKAGDTFSGRVTQPVKLGEKEVIPVGATVQGRIVSVTNPRRVKGVPTIEMDPQVIVMPTGERYTVNASVVDTNPETRTHVTDEGAIKGAGHDKQDLLVGGVGVGAGAGVGAAVGGGKGALIGLAIGAAAGATHWLWRRHDAHLPAGSEITMELNRPVQMAAGSGR